jgi:hypothetical protein
MITSVVDAEDAGAGRADARSGRAVVEVADVRGVVVGVATCFERFS